MPSHINLSIRFLDPVFHGRRDGGLPEWPPSPLRLFQSLVAAAARSGGETLDSQARSALTWLEQQKTSPIIVGPISVSQNGDGTPCGHLLSVPNNALDIVARAWSRWNESNSGDADPATHRALKPVRTTHLLDGDTVHYLWPLPERVTDEDQNIIGILFTLARSIVAVGWGVDLSVGYGSLVSDDQVANLPGERWFPGVEGAEEGLRVPVSGTLDALIVRHKAFLSRIRPDRPFNPTPPLPEFAYRKIEYRRATDPPRRAFAAFSLEKLDTTGFRSFDTVRSGLTVAGMMRHATKCAAQRAGWSEAEANEFILGHKETKDSAHLPVGLKRFAYLPLPSIEGRGNGKARVVGSVRRVMLTVFAEGHENKIAWARRALSGQELIRKDGGRSGALVVPVTTSDSVIHSYVAPASTWSSVTPVVLPGYDDPQHYRRRLKRGVDADEQKRLLECLDERIDSLLRKAIVQAGCSQELANHAELEWRRVSFWPGGDLADRYGVPDHLKQFSRLHVRIRWRDAHGRPVSVPGPVCLGGGRFYGLGLFAVE